MSMQPNLEALIEAAQHLTPEDRERLVKALLPPPRPPRQHRITEMRGLGKDLWQGVDAQEYLNAERDSWDNWPRSLPESWLDSRVSRVSLMKESDPK